MPDKTLQLHTGYTIYDGIRTNYYVDDVDSLDPEIRNYNRETIPAFSWTGFFALVREGEANGHRYHIQIGDLFYETKEI